jgi:hypothetical protein
MVTSSFVTNTDSIETGKIKQPMSPDDELSDDDDIEVSSATTQNTTDDEEELEDEDVPVTSPGSLTELKKAHDLIKRAAWIPAQLTRMTTRSAGKDNTTAAVNAAQGFVATEPEPKSMRDALAGPNEKERKPAGQKEIVRFHQHNVFKLGHPPEGANI